MKSEKAARSGARVRFGCTICASNPDLKSVMRPVVRSMRVREDEAERMLCRPSALVGQNGLIAQERILAHRSPSEEQRSRCRKVLLALEIVAPRRGEAPCQSCLRQLPIQSDRALLRAWLSRAATPPVLPSSNSASVRNGWNCSKRSRRTYREWQFFGIRPYPVEFFKLSE